MFFVDANNQVIRWSLGQHNLLTMQALQPCKRHQSVFFFASLLPWFALAREALQPVTKGFAACDAALRCEPGDEKVFTVSSCTQTHVDMML